MTCNIVICICKCPNYPVTDAQAGALLVRYNARITGDSNSDIDEPAGAPSASAIRQLALSKAPLSPLSGHLQGPGYLHRPGTEDDLQSFSHWVEADVASQVDHFLGSSNP